MNLVLGVLDAVVNSLWQAVLIAFAVDTYKHLNTSTLW